MYTVFKDHYEADGTVSRLYLFSQLAESSILFKINEWGRVTEEEGPGTIYYEFEAKDRTMVSSTYEGELGSIQSEQ